MAGGPWTFYKLPFLMIGSKTKFAAGIVDTGCKMVICIDDTSSTDGKLPPVPIIPVVHLDLRKSPRIFENIRNDPTVISRGLEVKKTAVPLIKYNGI
jgi:hypothetical protein